MNVTEQELTCLSGKILSTSMVFLIISCSASQDVHVPEGSVTPLQIMTSVSPGLMKLLSNCRTGQGVLSGLTSAGRPGSA